MNVIAINLKRGDVLLPERQVIVGIRPGGTGSVYVEVLPLGMRRSEYWRVDARYPFVIEEPTP